MDEIRGMTEAEARKLEAAGIRSAASLLRWTGTPAERAFLARRIGLNADWLLEWINRADLLRIDGIGPAYADLLERAGVDSVRELAVRNPEALLQALSALPPAPAGAAYRLPGLREVTGWIGQAKSTRRAVYYRALVPAARRRASLAILRQARRAGVSHLDPHLVTALALQLYGQDLLKAGAERELLVELDQLGRGELLQLEHRYAGGKEVKLSTVRATVSSEDGETVALRWYVRLPAGQVPKNLAVGDWVRHRPGRIGPQRLQPIRFRRLLSLLTNKELESVRQLFLEDLQNEALAKGSFRGKYGVDTLRHVEVEVDPGQLTAGSRLYIDHVDGDRVLLKPLNRRIRIGRLSMQLKVWLDRSRMPAALGGSTTRELLAAGNNEAIVVVGAGGSLSTGPYRMEPAPLPDPRREQRKNHYAAAEVPAGLRERLRAAVANPPVGPDGLRSAVRRGSVHIRWRYYEATGYLDGQIIWHVLIINDQLVVFEQRTRRKTEEQAELEAEVRQLSGEMTLKQGELNAVVAELGRAQLEIDELSRQKAEEEQAAAGAVAEQAAVDAEVANLREQYAGTGEELARQQADLYLDQLDLADEQEQAAGVQQELAAAQQQEEHLQDDEDLLAAQLEEKEEALAQAESEAEEAANAASEADVALSAGQAELSALEGRYSPTIVDRTTWGARAPNTAAGWDEYPTGTPLADLLNQVVVHHTADDQSMTIQELQNWEMDDNHYADVPYHFVITEDGTIYEGRQINAVGAHAGVSTVPNNTDITRDPDYGSIGIVVTGDFEQDYNTWLPDTPTAGQLASLKSLTGYLCRTYTVNPDQVLKHSEVARGGQPTVCPGENMSPQVERIRTELAAELPGYDAAVQAKRDHVAALIADRNSKQAAKEAAANRVSEMQEQVRQARADLEAVREELDAVHDEMDGLQADLDAHLAEAEEIAQRIAEREDVMQGLQEDLSDLGGRILEAEEHRQRAQELQGDIDAGRQHKAELEQDGQTLEQEIEELLREIDTKQERIGELNAEIGTYYEFGDEDGLDEEDIDFEADYEDPWTLLEENAMLGEWKIGKLQAMPNPECGICGLHVGEEYFFDQPQTPYHPNCYCRELEVTEWIRAR